MNTAPPKQDMSAKVRHYHAIYCSATGINLQLGICDAHRERSWYDFIRAGFTEQDIFTVANYLKREIRNGNRNPGCLKFSNMIAQLDRFEEDLGICKATARNAKPPMTPKQRVVEQLRPTAVTLQARDTVNTAKPIGELIQNLKQAAGML